jgi:hypothetical protein
MGLYTGIDPALNPGPDALLGMNSERMPFAAAGTPARRSNFSGRLLSYVVKKTLILLCGMS